MNSQPRYFFIIALVFISTFSSMLYSSPAAQVDTAQLPAPKYIFLFLADGAGIPHMEITRQYNRTIHNEGLVISDKIMKEGSLGLITTHPGNQFHDLRRQPSRLHLPRAQSPSVFGDRESVFSVCA